MSDFSFSCPHCSRELRLPLDVWYYTCEYCRESLDLKSQFAFLRGLDAFDEGQTLMMDKGPKRPRNKTRNNPVYREALNLFSESYSSLQVAFMGTLAEVQRQVGVEMMASMTAEFLRMNMISALEMSYWNAILTEQTAQSEIDRIKEKLVQKSGNINLLSRLRWNIRMRQLKNKLPDVDKKIRRLEEIIAFVDHPRARNKYWKP